jgi:hypothetical protein
VLDKTVREKKKGSHLEKVAPSHERLRLLPGVTCVRAAKERQKRSLARAPSLPHGCVVYTGQAR